MRRNPMSLLVRWASVLASPMAESPSSWRSLALFGRWALILITRGNPGDPPEPVDYRPAPRLSPEWLRRTGEKLSPEDKLYERIRRYFDAYAQHGEDMDASTAANIALRALGEAVRSGDVDLNALAELWAKKAEK